MRASLAPGLAVLLALCFAGCGKQETVPIGSRVSITPSRIDFGEVAVGPVFAQTLTLTNLTGDELELRGVDRGANFEGQRHSFFVIDLPSSIAGHASVSFGVTFEAFAEMDEAIESTFSVLTDYGPEPVSVRARGVKWLSVEPRRLDFGKVVRTDSKMLSLPVTNDGDSMFTIAVGSLQRIDGEGTFRIEDPTSDTIVVLPHGGARIDITYRPSVLRDAVGVDRARLTLSFCSNPLCEITVDMEGQGSDEALFCEHDVYDFGAVEIGAVGSINVICTVGAADAINVESAELLGSSAAELQPLRARPYRRGWNRTGRSPSRSSGGPKWPPMIFRPGCTSKGASRRQGGRSLRWRSLWSARAGARRSSSSRRPSTSGASRPALLSDRSFG